MSLHKEISFEDDICGSLVADGWLYVADSSQDKIVPLIIPRIAPNLAQARPAARSARRAGE